MHVASRSLPAFGKFQNYPTAVIQFYIVTLYDWLKNFAPLFRPIRSKPKTNRGLPARIFPRLEPAACICFEF